MLFDLDLSLLGLRHILEDETQNGPRPMPYDTAKALESLPSVALFSLAVSKIIPYACRWHKALNTIDLGI